MRETFDAALKLVLVHEGGYVDHPKDPGGATNKGITIGTYRSWLGRGVTKQELRAIPDSTVAAIYRSRYWNAVKGDDLPAGLDYAVFDFAVNSGPSRAVKFLQRIVGAAQDGKIGPKTLEAIAGHGAPNAISGLCNARLAWLRTLDTWSTFGKGWERRVVAVEKDALAMRMVNYSTTTGTYTRIPPTTDPPFSLPPEPSQPAQKAGFFMRIIEFLRRLFGNG